MLKHKDAGRGPDFAFIVMNIAILAGAALFLASSDAAYRQRVQVETLRDSKFLTTEWRLMKELKARTDRELRDKDLEIAELRARYRSLKGSGSSTEIIAAIEREMRRVEGEREAILTTRLAAAASPAAATATTAARVARGPLDSALPGNGDTPLSELLRNRVTSLEAALRSSKEGASAIERELDSLRRGAASADIARPAPPDAVAGPIGDGAVELILDALARERVALDEPDAVLGISDLKTRALLRAIVRTPAIRAEYPELLESLDRYLARAGKEEYLAGGL